MKLGQKELCLLAGNVRSVMDKAYFPRFNLEYLCIGEGKYFINDVLLI